MARIKPFFGIRYNPLKIEDLCRVVTQPYDKITPEMQENYYRMDPHNVVRITLGKENPQDDEKENKYKRARGTFDRWIIEGVLLREKTPSLYTYYQTFTTPSGEEKTRKGLIAHLLLEPFGSVVRPHEETLSKPKMDRLNLLREARLNTGQIFMLYSDPEQRVNKILDQESERKPEIDLVAEYGVRERVWVIREKMVISNLVRAIHELPLLIADGHHRYETALTFQKEQQSALSKQRSEWTGEENWNFRMVTLISMEDPGLLILPTHRLVQGITGFSLSTFLRKADRFFKIQMFKNEEEMFQSLKGGSSPLSRGLKPSPRDGVDQRIGFYGEKKFHLLTLKDKSLLEKFIAQSSEVRNGLDVVILHALVIEHCLGISQEEVLKGGKIRYLRDPLEGVRAVDEGDGQILLILNPTRVDQVRAMAERGEKMPQKSTDFFPKLLSGLVIAEV